MSDYDREPAWEQEMNTGQGRPAGGRGGDHTQEAIRTGKYTEVKTRLQQFYATYPAGAVVTESITMISPDRVMVQALAYRSADDPHPGRGTSWMVIPGKTPYTNGSEVENCETSAWGRAIAAVGIAIDQGIATAQEIRMKEGGEIEPPSLPADQLAAAAKARASTVPSGEAKKPEAAPSAPTTDEGKESTTETAGKPVTPIGDGDLTHPQAGGAGGESGASSGHGMTAEEATAKAAAETHIKPKRSRAKTPAPESVSMQGDGAPAPLPGAAVAETTAPKPDGNAESTEPQQGVDYDEFRRLAREKFIPDGHLAATARWMIESGRMPAVGSVREMTDLQRLVLLMAAIARMDDEEVEHGK